MARSAVPAWARRLCAGAAQLAYGSGRRHGTVAAADACPALLRLCPAAAPAGRSTQGRSTQGRPQGSQSFEGPALAGAPTERGTPLRRTPRTTTPHNHPAQPPRCLACTGHCMQHTPTCQPPCPATSPRPQVAFGWTSATRRRNPRPPAPGRCPRTPRRRSATLRAAAPAATPPPKDWAAVPVAPRRAAARAPARRRRGGPAAAAAMRTTRWRSTRVRCAGGEGPGAVSGPRGGGCARAARHSRGRGWAVGRWWVARPRMVILCAHKLHATGVSL
jgi:hypothetical protein